MAPVPERRSRRALVAGLAVAAAAVGLGAVTIAVVQPPTPAIRAGLASAPVAEAAGALAVSPDTGPIRPTTVDIPSLGLRSELLDLGVDTAGALVPPPTPALAGWFTGGAVPGEPGPAVIAGHVDSTSGPGVFYRLSEVEVGAEIEVGRSDGDAVRYRVTEVQTVPKDRFPTEEVYGPTPAPELHLITCGGEFDRSSGHYLRNVVVTAVLIDPV